MLATKRLARAASPFLGRSMTVVVFPRDELTLPREEQRSIPREDTKGTAGAFASSSRQVHLLEDIFLDMPTYSGFKQRVPSSGTRKGHEERDPSGLIPEYEEAGPSSSSHPPPPTHPDDGFPFLPQGPNVASSSAPSNATWDSIFENIDSKTSFLPTRRRLNSQTRDGSSTPRRQAITATEVNAFEDMFSMIFQAVEDRKNETPTDPATDASSRGSSEGVGRGNRGGVGELFSRMRGRARASSHTWTTNEDADFDSKAEQIELCVSDFDLLEWAQREVFAQSLAYEAAAREAIEERKKAGPGKRAPMPPLQPLPYPHILALLMRTFRDKYKDPHLALAMFDHARHLSISSYVFGCTTPAYNQLIETRWTCFRDLRGVLEALEEMKVNGIPPDARTRVLTEEVRREAGARKLWFDDEEVDFGQDMHMLERIEKLVAKRLPTVVGPPRLNERGRAAAAAVGRDAWKNPDMHQEGAGGWEFGEWPEPSPRLRRDGRELTH
ncbi:hypothetical protein OF83DRAFT_1081100 [Amylostereum chailletii]|nr:hypothetical protein OF83DRAFT_1081100 [Amylostereum chailletii]